MKNENLNLKIKRLPYSRLLKSEMADYVEKTIEIVESHEIESELINPMFVQLGAKGPDIKLLRLSYGIDTQRLRVSKLKAKMMLIISGLKLKVRLLSKSNPELDMHVIENAINTHLRHLDKCKNDKALSQKIAGFFDVANSDPDLQTALDDFELIGQVDAMTSIYNEVEEATKKRVRLLSQRPIVSTKELVDGMSKAVDNLFQSIEVANMLSIVTEVPEGGVKLDLEPLIDELSQLSEMYARSISIREANNKRKANKGKEGEEGEGEGEGEEGGEEDAGEPLKTAMCFGYGGDIDEGFITPFRMNNPEEENEAGELDESED